MRVASAIELSGEQRAKLLKLAHSQTASVRLARRCAIVLLADDGYDNLTIADMLDVGRIQTARWAEALCRCRAGCHREGPAARRAAHRPRQGSADRAADHPERA